MLSATAIPAVSISDEMDNSRSRRQVLILDCCHSGAFAKGSKGATGDSVGTATVFQGTGYGRVVLTATDSTQYAWEGDEVIGDAENSVFTHYLIQGLRTGEADADSDGEITLNELYDYVYAQVVEKTPKQTPGKWSFKEQGDLVVARNLHPAKPAELPVQLQNTIASEFASVREGAVKELSRLLQGSHRGLALSAQKELDYMAEHDDSRQASRLAAGTLQAHADGSLQQPDDEEDTAVKSAKPDERQRPEEAEQEQQTEAERADEERQEQLVGLYESGKRAMEDGAWEFAINAFRQVVDLDKGYRDAGYLLGQTEANKRAHEERQEQLVTLYDDGKRAMEDGAWEPAIRAFQRVVDLDREYREAAYLLEQAEARKKAEERRQPPVNTSGQGKDAVVPDEIRKWNWGAFLLGGFWGLGNKTYVAGLVAFIPYVNFVMSFVLGAKGNEWAWRNKRWDSIEHFQRVQKRWTQWAIGLIIALIVIVFYSIGSIA